ncbi:MAG: MFS transporter [Fibrobacteres bacterium]|nr:MFS transporter [Fibrobacterota bacterium]
MDSNIKPSLTVGSLSYTKPKLAILFFWLLWGDFCFMLMENLVPSILPLKFKELGASNVSVGMILTTLPMLINTVFNPIISFKSDRHRGRFGRRIPFILFTLPLLTICLVALGFSDQWGFKLHSRFSGHLGSLTPTTAALIVMGAVMVCFAFFNTFVNSVFWYLFNDVVPEHLLGRFMAWFRMVSVASVSFYNFFIFKHAESHYTTIFVGAAALYLIGFGLMCLNVKEGTYPPPPPYIKGETGALAAIKTYGKECLGLKHYWFVFLSSMCMAVGYSAYTFWIYLYQATGLSLEQIGNVTGVFNISMAIVMLFTGWLADKYHPIRIVMIGLLFFLVIVMPVSMVWFFWQPSQQSAYYFWMFLMGGLTAPALALIQMNDPSMFMRVFPRDRYGQYCSANALLRSLSLIISGLLLGWGLDTVKSHYGEKTAYFCLPIWQFIFYGLMLAAVIALYKSWKKYGGDESYVPPVPK